MNKATFVLKTQEASRLHENRSLSWKSWPWTLKTGPEGAKFWSRTLNAGAECLLSQLCLTRICQHKKRPLMLGAHVSLQRNASASGCKPLSSAYLFLSSLFSLFVSLPAIGIPGHFSLFERPVLGFLHFIENVYKHILSMEEAPCYMRH